MAPHSFALRALGVATVIYAAILAVAPLAGLRRVSRFGPAYQTMLMQDPEYVQQLAAGNITPEQATQEALRHMVRGAQEQAAPALLLSAVGVLGGVLLWFRRRAGPWIVLLFAVWPGVSWIVRAMGGGKAPQHPELARRLLGLDLFGKHLAVDVRTYGTAFQLAFLLATLGILGWAFAAGRRNAERAAA